MSHKPTLQIRRPPAAPSPAQVESFVNGGAVTEPVSVRTTIVPAEAATTAESHGAEGSLPADSEEKSQAATSAPPASTLQTAIRLVEVDTADKPTATTEPDASEGPRRATHLKRRPSKAQETAETPRKVTSGLVLRKSGRIRRRTTVYFDLDLAKRLTVYAATTDQDISDIVEAAVSLHLDRHDR